jgi:hypothetical protein
LRTFPLTSCFPYVVLSLRRAFLTSCFPYVVLPCVVLSLRRAFPKPFYSFITFKMSDLFDPVNFTKLNEPIKVIRPNDPRCEENRRQLDEQMPSVEIIEQLNAMRQLLEERYPLPQNNRSSSTSSSTSRCTLL